MRAAAVLPCGSRALSEGAEWTPKKACQWALKTPLKQGIIRAKIGKNLLIHYARYYNIGGFSLLDREKAGEEKRGERRLWECGKPYRFSIISMAGARGKRGRWLSL